MKHLILSSFLMFAANLSHAESFFPAERTLERKGVEYIILDGTRLTEETGKAFGRNFYPRSSFEGAKIAIQMHIGVTCPPEGPIRTSVYSDGWGVQAYEKHFVGREVFKARTVPASLFQTSWPIFLNEHTETASLTDSAAACRRYWQDKGNWRFDPTYVVYGALHQNLLTNGKYSEHWIELDAVEFADRVIPSINIPSASPVDLLSLR